MFANPTPWRRHLDIRLTQREHPCVGFAGAKIRHFFELCKKMTSLFYFLYFGNDIRVAPNLYCNFEKYSFATFSAEGGSKVGITMIGKNQTGIALYRERFP